MYMIRAHIDCLQMPLPNPTRLANSFFNRSPLSCSEDKGVGFKLFAIVAMPSIDPREIRITVLIVKAIDRAAFVAM